MPLRIIFGPEAMFVERHGIRSETRPLTAKDGPAEVRAIARDLWETIRPFVSWAVWTRHRLLMAWQRRIAARIAADWPGPFHPGPRPDLIAQKLWNAAAYREWTLVHPGVAARLLGGRL